MFVTDNMAKNIHQIIVGCSDGSLRCYPFEKLSRPPSGQRREEVQPTFYKWESSDAPEEKRYKHEVVGTGKEEYPLWISVNTLAGDNTQYLVCFTEEGLCPCRISPLTFSQVPYTPLTSMNNVRSRRSGC